MSYKYISKEEFKQRGINPDFDTEKEYQTRLNGPSTFKTALFPLLTKKDGTQQDDRPIFFVETRKMAQAKTKINENSQLINSLSYSLPGVAKHSYSNSLLVSEIKYTNEIEGIETHRKELGTIVGEVQNNTKPDKNKKRLVSTIKLYNDILSKPVKPIKDYQDLRDLYNKLTNGEISDDKKPDGEYFRNSRVYIGQVAVETHVPPVTESQIKPKIKSLIDFMNNDDYPSIEKAIVTHFMFENTHPFYDGNGRTGRYLLSQYLSSKIDVLTALSLSGAIRDNEAKYYKNFKEAEIYKNYCELTFFIEDFLDIIIEAQKNVIDNLHVLKDNLDKAMDKILKDNENSYTDIEKTIIFIFVQSKIFTSNISLGIKDTQLVDMLYLDDPTIYKKRETKRIIDKLTKVGLLKSIGLRPKQHEIDSEILNAQ